jgi:hypothetical protein
MGVVFHYKDELRSLSLESLVGDYLPYLYECQLLMLQVNMLTKNQVTAKVVFDTCRIRFVKISVG